MEVDENVYRQKNVLRTEGLRKGNSKENSDWSKKNLENAVQ